MKWQDKNAYEILEVDQDANDEEIKNAWRLQILAWHPDRFKDIDFKKIANERTQKIYEAYDELTDPKKREKLDERLEPDYKPPFKDDDRMNIPDNWKALASFMKEHGLGTSKERRFAYEVADQYLEKRIDLSEDQKKWAIKIWKKGENNEFRP